ncbi:MAG: T9SS type A sorting domain-containing protein [Candidatus Neomarinimicrobiota bacterium]
MNRSVISGLCSRVILLGILSGIATPLMGQAINVTIQFNSATVLDTLGDHHFVQIRGELNGAEGTLPDGNSITWNSTSDLILDNIGGDYWEKTFQMNPDDTLAYKFWTGFDATTGTSVVWDGWEGPLVNPDGLGGDNRILITGASDTILVVQYYNSSTSSVDQYWRPYEPKPDTVAVYFRVNMAGAEERGDFDPATNGPVIAKGGSPLGEPDPWTQIATLIREATSGVGGSFWSGAGYVAVADLSADDQQGFKFVYDDGSGGEVWETTGDRTFTFSADLIADARDTTIHWAYFNDQGPTGLTAVKATVTWRVDPGALETLGFFDRSVGDAIWLAGPKGWTIPSQALPLTYQPILGHWIAQDLFEKIPGDEFPYKYVIRFDSSRVDETSPNYIPGLDLTEYWEEPSVTGGANRMYTYTDASSQVVAGDFGRDYQFFNSIPPEGVLTDPITVTFNIDMANAADAEVNTANPLFRPGVDTAYVLFEGSLMALSQGMSLWGDELTRGVMLSDDDADGVYSGSLELSAPTVYQAGFIVGYTQDGGWITNGGGLLYGRRYFQFIWPESHVPDGETIWPSAYDFPVLDWVPGNLAVETPPDFTQPLSVNEHAIGVPGQWRLQPNYPNPFNPTTIIGFEVATTAKVNIAVYNILGQRVMTLIDRVVAPGHYSVFWNGMDESGSTVASGVYFVRMHSEEFSQVHKMTLLR